VSGSPADDSGRSSTFDRGVEVVADAIQLGLRPFAAPAGEPRVRRATDVVTIVTTAVVLAYLIAVYPPSRLELSLMRTLAALPSWLAPAWDLSEAAVGVWALLLVASTLVARRLLVTAQTALTLVVALGIGVVVARLATGSWPDVTGMIVDRAPADDFPDIRLAASVVVIATISPHLVRPLRSFGYSLVVLGAVGSAASLSVTPGGALAALMIGLLAASIVNLATGTSAGRPGIDAVEAALAELGVRAHDLERETRQTAGIVRLTGADADGRPIRVKLYGRDAADNQRIARIWQSISYRHQGPAVGSSGLHAVEREAFVTLLARRAGIVSLDVVTAGATAGDDALLVLAGDATPFSSLDPGIVDDALLHAAWDALAQLAELRIAHQQLDLETLVVIGGDVGFVDFGGATVAPHESQLDVDRAQLLAATAALAGQSMAVAAAVDALGADGVASLLPYLQDAALSAPLRKAIDASGVEVDELRARAADAVGTEAPDLVKLRRVSWRSAIQIALLGLASYTIVSAASGVDWDEVRTSIEDASWAWIALGFVVAQLPRLTQAISTLGSVPARLPFGPVYAMQLATGYMNVALPANLARLAVNIRFFQRQGLSSTVAVASGAIDSFVSTVIQAILLALLLVFSSATVQLDVPWPSGDPRRLAWILAAIVVAAVVVLVTIPRIRNAMRERVSQWWPDVKATVASLRGGHKLGQLLLGSLGTEILFAVALGVFARGFGYDLSLAELLLINISVSLLGSLVPIPGNIGVAEFGLTLGLTGAGMTPEAALGAVFLYRIATFYLPPIWGFFALRWLQRRRFL
jgi:uncharacterized membrane protein YbhN (UPF0104 family)